jgi:hypothetical protein
MTRHAHTWRSEQKERVVEGGGGGGGVVQVEGDALLAQFADFEEGREDVAAVVVVEEHLPHALPVALGFVAAVEIEEAQDDLCMQHDTRIEFISFEFI